MEVIDRTDISDIDAKAVFEKARPCGICGCKDGLALGVVTGGPAAGRILLYCHDCQFSPVDDKDSH